MNDEQAAHAEPSVDEGADDRVPVVGIGASAGGLEALSEMLAQVRPGSEAAFVVVQHLAADQKSLLHELLQNHCKVPVAQIVPDEPIEAGRIYVVPPGKLAEIRNNRLHLIARPETDQLFRPIDHFFDSLAKGRGRNGYCVVLSGTGSDGSAGLRAVKAAGGFAIAQESSNARFPGMPDSAVATGLVDFVLPGPAIVPRLEEIMRHRRSIDDDVRREQMRAGIERALPAITDKLREVTGHDFSDYKPGTMIRRIERRMMLMRIDDVRSFVDRLTDEEHEASVLGQEFLIGVTEFFRDPDAFEALRQKVVAPVLDREGGGVRVWVPGCSSGEEAYSIAILFLEEMQARDDRRPLQIFGTDIDTHALLAARYGLYSAASAAALGEDRLARFFQVESGQYRARPELREVCVFAPHNMVQDPPFSRLDLISCRNLMIYLSSDLQRRVMPRFHFSLKPHGYLFLGPSEGIAGDDRLFDVVDKTHRLFRRNDEIEPSYSSLTDPLPRTRDSKAMGRGRGPSGTEMPQTATREVAAEREFLRRYAAPFAVVSRAGEVRYLSHGMTRFARPAQGTPSNQIDTFLAGELRVPTRTALAAADEGGEEHTIPGVLVRQPEGEPQVFDVSAAPMRSGTDEFLVVLSGVRATDVQSIGAVVETRDSADRDILEQENVRLRRQLSAALQEYETSGQELKSTNEELMSMNEELETSREELQSINEELETVNAELRENNRQLMRANSDLKNLFESTDVAVLFLDRNFCVRNYTPATTVLYGVRQRDIGRPIFDLSSRIEYPQLKSDAETVDATLQPIDREVRIESSDETFLLRMKPYRTTDDRIDGYVLSFVDITARTRTEAVLEQNRRNLAEQYAELENLYDTTPVGLSLIDRDFRYIRINETLARINGITVADHIGKRFQDLLPKLADEMTGLYREVFDTGEPHLGMEIHASLPSAPYDVRDFISDLYPVFVDGKVRFVGTCVREVTDLTRMIHRVEQQNQSQRLLLAELQHRVKNTLATIRAISRMLLKGATDAEDFHLRLSDRLTAIARTHDLLTDADWSTAQLRDIILSEASPYQRDDRNSVRITGPAVPLDAKQALALGMAIHELMTNAAKYGALSNDTGRINIALEYDEETGKKSIRWTEVGGPPVGDPGGRQGFGTVVIERVLKADIGAEIETNYAPGGLQFTATF